MSIPDPYKVLQVDSEAEVEVIEAAYRRLARKYHPDVATGPEAQQRMVRINQAWELLKDPVRRVAVDRARARAAAQAARVTAADAQSRTAGEPGGTAAGGAGQRRQESPRPGGGTQRHGEAWPMPGARDPSDARPARPRPETVSRDSTSGRSSTGSTYDQSTMRTPHGAGSVGPPPGNPSGMVLNFGRYAGWSLGEVARVEIEYLEWLDRVPIGRQYQHEIDGFLRAAGRRAPAAPAEQPNRRGLFRRR